MQAEKREMNERIDLDSGHVTESAGAEGKLFGNMAFVEC